MFDWWRSECDVSSSRLCRSHKLSWPATVRSSLRRCLCIQEDMLIIFCSSHLIVLRYLSVYIYITLYTFWFRCATEAHESNYTKNQKNYDQTSTRATWQSQHSAMRRQLRLCGSHVPTCTTTVRSSLQQCLCIQDPACTWGDIGELGLDSRIGLRVRLSTPRLAGIFDNPTWVYGLGALS